MDDQYYADSAYRCEYGVGYSPLFYFSSATDVKQVTSEVFLPYTGDNYIDAVMFRADVNRIYESYTVNGTPPTLKVIYSGNTTIVYRMANWMTKERLFTTNLDEVNAIADKNGWVYENIAFYANNTGSPVYRMANWMTHERLFTTNWNEVQAIKDKNGWVYEGLAFYAQ